MARTGRPSKYSPELADEICKAIAMDSRGIEHVCKERDDFPTARTIRAWIITNEDFIPKYARARELQMELLASEIIEIAEEEPMMTISFGENGTKTCVDNAGIQRNRLRVDTRKWLMSKLAPKKYGDKVEHQHEIGDNLASIISKGRDRIERIGASSSTRDIEAIR